MKFDTKETEEYFYLRCRIIGCKLVINEDFTLDYNYVKNYLDMIEEGLKSGRFTHLNK